MALNTETRAAIAFKKSLGLANAQTANPFFSEVVPTQFSIAAQEVLGEEIEENPNTATNVKQVVCDLQEAPGDGFANGFGYNIVLRQGETIPLYNTTVTVDDGNGGNSPENRKTRRFRTSSGQFLSVRIIPQKFNRTLSTAGTNPGYGYDLFDPLVNDDPNDASSQRIARTSATEWQIDPFAGTLVAENTLNLNTANAGVFLYVYTGPTVQDVLDEGVGGGGGLIGVASPQGPGIDITDINASTGEATLAVNLGDTVSNTQNDTTNGVNFNYDTGTRVGTFSLNTSFLDGQYLRNDGDSGQGVYNFNSGVLFMDSTEFTVAAQNLQINSNGTVNIDGDLIATDPNNAGLGAITCVTLTEISSARYKSDIEALTGVSERLGMLEPVTYRSRKSGRSEMGFIAEQIADVFPEVVHSDNEGRPDSVNYGRLTSALVQGFRELQKMNESLRQRLEQHIS